MQGLKRNESLVVGVEFFGLVELYLRKGSREPENVPINDVDFSRARNGFRQVMSTKSILFLIMIL